MPTDETSGNIRSLPMERLQTSYASLRAGNLRPVVNDHEEARVS
jgi:hypothetical protein